MFSHSDRCSLMNPVMKGLSLSLYLVQVWCPIGPLQNDFSGSTYMCVVTIERRASSIVDVVHKHVWSSYIENSDILGSTWLEIFTHPPTPYTHVRVSLYDTHSFLLILLYYLHSDPSWCALLSFFQLISYTYSRRSAAGSARTKVTRCHKRKCRCRSRSNILL